MDEEDFSREEYEEAESVWKVFSVEERKSFLRRSGTSDDQKKLYSLMRGESIPERCSDLLH